MGRGFYQPAGDLPHKPISLSLHLIVEDAVRAGWQRLRQHPPAGFDIETAHEDVVTHELKNVLHDEVFDTGVVEGFDAVNFNPPSREAKFENYNGKKRDLMPDLFFGLRGRQRGRVPRQDGLFVECKPVGRKHPVGSKYCKEGVARFERGDYAWAMTSTLMIGYASEGYSIFPKLDEALKKRPKKLTARGTLKACPKSKAGNHSEVVHSSEHHRRFKYKQTQSPAPAITIRHLWLKRSTRPTQSPLPLPGL